MAAADQGRLLFDELMRFRPDGLTANAWAVKAGVSRNFWNDLRRHGNPSRRTLEKLLAAADSSLAEFEALRLSEQPAPDKTTGGRLADLQGRAWSPPPLPPLPLVASAFGGEWGAAGRGIDLTRISKGDRLGPVSRPASLAADPDAYAVTTIGDSMWPRFRPGRRIAVSPRSPVAIGDDVVVLLVPTGNSDSCELALIKELVRRTASFIELRQFNPGLTFRVEMANVETIQKVAGELIQ